MWCVSVTVNVNPSFHRNAVSHWLFPTGLLICCESSEERMDRRIREISGVLHWVLDAFSGDKPTGKDHRTQRTILHKARVKSMHKAWADPLIYIHTERIVAKERMNMSQNIIWSWQPMHKCLSWAICVSVLRLSVIAVYIWLSCYAADITAEEYVLKDAL